MIPAVPVLDPPGGVDYPRVLTGPDQSAPRSLFGVLLGISAFILLVPLTAQLILGLTSLFRRPDSFADYQREAMAYELPEGVAASHLALATLIIVAVLLVRYLHGRAPRWLVSVQPGFRWRYLVGSLLIALVVLNGVLWLSFPVVGAPEFTGPQPGWWVFLAVILVTSPLQAAAEEFFFRGYVLQALGSASGRAWVGIVGSALVFALFHGVQNPALFVNRFAFGLVAGWLVWRTGGLEAAIAAHVINNLFAFGYGLFSGGVAATKAVTEITWLKSVFDVAGFAIFAAAAWWLGRRMRVAEVTP